MKQIGTESQGILLAACGIEFERLVRRVLPVRTFFLKGEIELERLRRVSTVEIRA